MINVDKYQGLISIDQYACVHIHIKLNKFVMSTTHMNTYFIHKYKNNKIGGWSRDGRIKSTHTRCVRDSRIYYTSLRLLFFIISHLLMSTYLSSEVCGWHSGCSLVVTMMGWSVWFNRMHYYWLFLRPSKKEDHVDRYRLVHEHKFVIIIIKTIIIMDCTVMWFIRLYFTINHGI